MPHRHLKHESEEDDDDNEVSGRPLTIVERRAVRRMIETEERIQWFWGSVRVWVGWISGGIVAAAALVEILSHVWKKT